MRFGPLCFSVGLSGELPAKALVLIRHKNLLWLPAEHGRKRGPGQIDAIVLSA